MSPSPRTAHRKLWEIARDIRAHWPNVNYAAKPYLLAMSSLGDITESFYLDSGESVVAYFLANAGSWRGEDARRVKKELNGMLKSMQDA